MFTYIDDKIFYKIVTKHPDWFPNWENEGHQIWNRVTGEIVTEDGRYMMDGVYRGGRDYNNYWKDCFQDSPKSISGGPSDLSITLSYDDYVKDPESTLVHVTEEVNNKATLSL